MILFFLATQMCPIDNLENVKPHFSLLTSETDELGGLVMKKPSPIKADLLRSLSLSSPGSNRVRSYSEGQNQETQGSPGVKGTQLQSGDPESENLVSEGLSFFTTGPTKRGGGMTGTRMLRKQSDSRIAFYRAEYMPCMYRSVRACWIEL